MVVGERAVWGAAPAGMRLESCALGSVPPEAEAGRDWAFRLVSASDPDRRLAELRLTLRAVSLPGRVIVWSHMRRRTRRGWCRFADVEVYRSEWPARINAPVCAVNPTDAEVVHERVANGKWAWWRYVWEPVELRDAGDAVVFGVAQAAWYCLRKEKSIKDDMPTYPAAARHGIAALADWRAWKEPEPWR